MPNIQPKQIYLASIKIEGDITQFIGTEEDGCNIPSERFVVALDAKDIHELPDADKQEILNAWSILAKYAKQKINERT